MRVLLRYLGFQIPGWIVVAGLLAAAMEWWHLSAPLAATLLGLFVLKDLVLFPLVRIAYEPGAGRGTRDPQGRRAVAQERLHPAGYVRVGSELWRAELVGGGEASPGTVLRVTEMNGFTLLVEKEPNP